MKINFKKIAGSAGALILGIGGLIAAGKSGFCENLGKHADDEAPAEPKDETPAEPAAEEVEAEEVSDNGEEAT